MTSKTVQTLKELYVENYVVIIMKDMKMMAMVNDEELQVSSMMEGYVVDVDEYFVYLSDDEKSDVSRAVKHDIISIIQISPDEDDVIMSEGLDMDFPEEGDLH